MSGIATGTALAIGLGASAAAGIGTAAISANAAGDAAQTQADAAMSGAQLQYKLGQQSLQFQEDQWKTQQQNIAPWLQAGKSGLSELESELGIGPSTGANYGELTKGFTPPTEAQAENYPGYQFQLQQGEEALQNSAAARGNLISGNDLTALSTYNRNAATSDYANVYNQMFNTFETNQLNRYNRLAGISGVGQQAATTLGQEGQAAAGNFSTINSILGRELGADYQNAAAATASGYVGQANAWSGALGGATGSLMNYYLLNNLLNQGGGAGLTQADLAAGGNYFPPSLVGGP